MATLLASGGGEIWTQLSDFLVGILWVMNKDKHVSIMLGTMLSHSPCDVNAAQ